MRARGIAPGSENVNTGVRSAESCRRQLRVAGGITAAFLLGCAEPPSTQLTAPALRTTRSASAHGSKRHANIRTFDDEMVALVDSIPGFGGFHVDPTNPQQYVVHLTDLHHRDVAERVLSAYLRRYRNPTRRLTFQQSAYDFRQLSAWQDAIEQLGVAGFTLSDVDERSNHVHIGVRTAAGAQDVASRLLTLGIPASAALVEEIAPMVVQTVLHDYIRPVAGGMQITAAGTCTLTGLMREDYASLISTSGPVYAMTNAHCTDAFGIVTGNAIGQPDQANRIGAEVYDPPLFTNAADATCPPGRSCRYTDAALFALDPGVDVSGFNYSAWTDALNSTTFSGYNIYQSVEAFFIDPMGNAVTKVGRTTGRTSGLITGTCVKAPQYEMDYFGNLVDTGRTLLCQYETNYADGAGDSGSPVAGEGYYQKGLFWFDGIHWGGNETTGVFSSWSYLRDEFRMVTPGGWYPSPVPQNGY